MARTHRIAVVPGDGIGKETVPEALKVLDAASRRFGFGLEFAHYDWSCETYKKTGAMMPADGMERLAQSDSILLGAVGWPDVPDHVSLWGLLIPIRRGFDQYVNLRPCKLMPGVRTPLAGRTEADIDFYVVRENTEGEYSSVGGRMFEGTEREFVSPAERVHPPRRGPHPEIRVRTGDDAAEEAPDIGHQVERHHLHHAVLGRTLRADGQDRIPTSAPTSSTSTSCARISCSIRTGSTWWSAPTCSATSCPTSVRRWRVRSASRRRPTSIRSGSFPRCSSRCTARRPTSRASSSATRSARSGRPR